VGVWKTTVSREAIAASEAALKQWMERRYDPLDLLIIAIEGMPLQDQGVPAAVGVEVEGRKHVLAGREGATENAAAAKDLLRHRVEHGGDPGRRRLCVTDGSKALRPAIHAVFGADTPVPRCRNHKLRHVLGRLPRRQQAQTASLMGAAWKRNHKEGMARFRQIAGWRKHDGRTQQRRCGKAWRRVAPSTGWRFRRGCIGAWRPATSWTIRLPACASARAASVAGSPAWPRVGRRLLFCKSRSRCGKLWVIGSCGPGRPS